VLKHVVDCETPSNTFSLEQTKHNLELFDCIEDRLGCRYATFWREVAQPISVPNEMSKVAAENSVLIIDSMEMVKLPKSRFLMI
jgi:hypothetical protein